MTPGDFFYGSMLLFHSGRDLQDCLQVFPNEEVCITLFWFIYNWYPDVILQ